MSELSKFEKIDDDVFIYEKTTIEEVQINLKHLEEEKIRLQKRIYEIDNILEEIRKMK